MPWWDTFSCFNRPANPRDSWQCNPRPATPWQLSGSRPATPWQMLDGRDDDCDDDDIYFVPPGGYVPPRIRRRSFSRPRSSTHNPGVTVVPERSHLLTPRGMASPRLPPCVPPPPDWVPMNPFVGPSLVGSPGRRGKPHISTPLMTPGGVPLATPAWPAAMPLVATPHGPAVPLLSTPVGPAVPVSSWPWVPHPWPAPNVPGHAFWPAHWLSFPRAYSPFDPSNAMVLTGGNPLPATVPVGWAPAWPPEDMRIPVHLHPTLAPNPFNTMPHLDWDLSHYPQTAKRITGRNIIMDAGLNFNDTATWPPTQSMVIACDYILQESWGPIHAQNSGGVKVYDVLHAIHEYFQEILTERDVDRMLALDPTNYQKMVSAWRERCDRSYSIRGWERSQGLRRIDLLGDNRKWWGLWIRYTSGTWYANLGVYSPGPSWG